MTTYLFNDGRASDMRSANLKEAAEAVAASMPDGAEKTRAMKAAQSLRSEFRGKGKASQYFWAPSRG